MSDIQRDIKAYMSNLLKYEKKIGENKSEQFFLGGRPTFIHESLAV